MVSLNYLLERMDCVDWSKIPDFPKGKESVEEVTRRFRGYKNLLLMNGVSFKGLVLDLCSGPVGFGCVYPNTVALDVDWHIVKEVRKNGFRAVQGDMCNLEFDDGTFDIVLSFFPPVDTILQSMPWSYDSESIGSDRLYMAGYLAARTWQQRYVQYAVPLVKPWGRVILHDNGALTDHKLNTEFLGFYGLSASIKVRLGKGFLYVFDKM